jgi:hypothetical protein
MQRVTLASRGIYARKLISSCNQEWKPGETNMACLSCATARPPMGEALENSSLAWAPQRRRRCPLPSLLSKGIYARKLISSCNQERKPGETNMACLSCATARPPMGEALENSSLAWAPQRRRRCPLPSLLSKVRTPKAWARGVRTPN